jgi:hypothetical protein
MTTAATRPALTDDDLVELLPLIEGADTVELKLTVPESAHRTSVAALGMDPLEAQIRQVFFFDTPDLALSRGGVVVRGRRVQGKGDDSVVKLRPVVPGDLSKSLRAADGFGVEVDVMPGGFVCSASFKNALPAGVMRRVAAGKAPTRKLFSKPQRAFFAAQAPEGITLDDLKLMGPVFVLKLRFAPKGGNRRIVAELWLYPDGSRILELSTKCAPPEAFRVSAEQRAFLTSQGIDLGGEQATKTHTALEFFAREHVQSSGLIPSGG